jgi:4-amino-4-deoxy-L-arabinose transferase-like glycosyltransferase
MSSHLKHTLPHQQPGNTPAPPARWWIVPGYLVVGLAALALRVTDLGSFVTHDEIEFWFRRSESLLQALQSGRYDTMEITTHPGVTTMWLGAAGISLRRLLFEHHLLTNESFPVILALHRLPVALAHVAALLAGYGMLRRLLPGSVALLAALLWATDPFIIGYSRLLHVDALVGSFATLSLLAACLAWQHPNEDQAGHIRWRWLLLSSICGALAALSKSPGLAVVPIVGLLALREWRTENGKRSIGQTVWPLLAWGVIYAITIVVAWPALWAAPAHVYEALRVGVEVEGSSPHMMGNFFLGERIAAPGPLYYPVALALRTTPWALAGLLLLPLAMWPPTSARPALRTLAVLAGFIILFVVAMSFFPKKFNRYSVPVFPALDILAAVGVAWGIEQLARLVQLARLGERAQTRATHTLLGLVVLATLLNAAWFHPYTITYFNQTFGGARAGARTFAIGWGEGFEQVAAWLNQQPDSPHVLTISHMITSLTPYLKPGVRATFPDAGRLKAGAGYVVVYVYQVQGGPPPPPFDQFYGHAPPLHTVTIHGVDYAWIYDAPPPVAQQTTAEFGSHIRLYGFDGEVQAQPGQTLRLKLVWQTDTSPQNNYWLFAHLIGPNGQRHAQIDQPYPTSQWVPGRFVVTELVLALPDDIPAGSYALTPGLYDATTNQRLPLHTTAPPAPPTAGPHALLLTHIHVGSSPPSGTSP